MFAFFSCTSKTEYLLSPLRYESVPKGPSAAKPKVQIFFLLTKRIVQIFCCSLTFGVCNLISLPVTGDSPRVTCYYYSSSRGVLCLAHKVRRKTVGIKHLTIEEDALPGWQRCANKEVNLLLCAAAPLLQLLKAPVDRIPTQQIVPQNLVGPLAEHGASFALYAIANGFFAHNLRLYNRQRYAEPFLLGGGGQIVKVFNYLVGIIGYAEKNEKFSSILFVV